MYETLSSRHHAARLRGGACAARGALRPDPERRVEAAGRARTQAHRPRLEDQPRQDRKRLLRGLRPRRQGQPARDLLPPEDLRDRQRAEKMILPVWDAPVRVLHWTIVASFV